MARPTKQTVDYFPHYCNHGKTIYILEQRYGVKGYAFWFKLLEELGKNEGHFLDLNDDSELEYLGAKTEFLPTETLEVLTLLSKLGAIDTKLWKNRMVWCDNFIEHIKDVYTKRTVSVPIKPVYDNGNPVKGDRKPQTKLKETKVSMPFGNKHKTMYKEPIIELDEDGEEVEQKTPFKLPKGFIVGISKYYSKLFNVPETKGAFFGHKKVIDAMIEQCQKDDKLKDNSDKIKETIQNKIKQSKDRCDKEGWNKIKLSTILENWNLKEKEIKLEVSERRII